jgi:hypothetical protein
MSALLWLLRLLLGWTSLAAFVRAFGDPQTALAAIVVVCVTVVLVVAMAVWQATHLGRLRILAEMTVLEKTGRPVRRTRRFLGQLIWEYEQVVGELDRPRDDRPKAGVPSVQEAPPPALTPDAGG